ncbi:MAG: hypothetical protein H5U16_11065 [Roseovarius sp.]|nr:hypothetical protein [Roseovarius sp.]
MGALWQLWWVWGAAALVLAILETVLPGFVLLGFACGAALVALLVLLPLKIGLSALLAIFVAFSLLSWVALRRAFRRPDDQTRVIREDINK